VIAIALATVPIASSAFAANDDDESSFTLLTGPNAADKWTSYGADADHSKWPDSWKAEDDVLHCVGGGKGDLRTKQPYADFDLRFEWKVPPRGNSGLMYRVEESKDPAYHTGPEFQLLDNAGHSDGGDKLTSTGSLYGMYGPTQEVAKPAGQWNSARILVQDKHIQHFLNGKLIVSAVIGSPEWNRLVSASKFSAWKKFGLMPTGYIVLQDHGDEVWFRNIRLKALDVVATIP
jgi:hypothetical protein